MITLVPAGGLANRMKAIDAAILLARRVHKRLRIIWIRDAGLNCRFDQLFQPLIEAYPHEIEVREATWSDCIRYDRPRRKDLWIPRLFQFFLFDRVLSMEETTRCMEQGFDFEQWAGCRHPYLASCVYFYTDGSPRFSIFHPTDTIVKQKEAICAKQYTRPMIGIHIRRTDNLVSIQESPIELFVEKIEEEITRCNGNCLFYLATDSEYDKNYLRELFGERILTSPIRPIGTVFWGFRTPFSNCFCSPQRKRSTVRPKVLIPRPQPKYRVFLASS